LTFAPRQAQVTDSEAPPSNAREEKKPAMTATPDAAASPLSDLSKYTYGTTRLGDGSLPFAERVKIVRRAEVQCPREIQQERFVSARLLRTSSGLEKRAFI
jgi:hypothetical protein